MNCVVYPSSPNTNHHGDQKYHQERFEPPPPPDLALGRCVGANSSNNAGLVGADLHPVGAPFVGPQKPQAPLHVGKYLLLHQLEGSTLYKAVNIETREELVCKIVNNDGSRQILNAHFRLDSNEHINEIQGVLIGEQKTYVFFSPSHGDLYSYVRTRRRLREVEAQRLFSQVAAAVAHCHENRVVLRDLKLRKFVFRDSERTKLKLESLEDAVVLEDEDDSLSDKHCCPAYVSPEILTVSSHYSGCAADCWSLGVMLYAMLVGRYPFHGTEPSLLFAKIRRSQVLIPEWLSSRARCLIRGLLRPNPTERLTAADVLAHPWLQSETPDIVFKCDNKFPDQMVPSGITIPVCKPESVPILK